MRIACIGSGRLAHHLLPALATHHQISHVCARQRAHAQDLAQRVGALAVDSIAMLPDELDLVVVAVNDGAIAEVVAKLHARLPEVLLVHTSGSTDIAVIADVHQRAGVFYPLQTFSLQAAMDWHSTPLLLEAIDAGDKKLLRQLAQGLSERVYDYDSTQRLSLHLAAVFACNFANYCYDMAEQVLAAQGVDFALLHPLMQATAAKACAHSPRSVQTGPAVRGDEKILALHETLLQQAGQSDLLAAYRLLSQGIMQGAQYKP